MVVEIAEYRYTTSYGYIETLYGYIFYHSHKNKIVVYWLYLLYYV